MTACSRFPIFLLLSFLIYQSVSAETLDLKLGLIRAGGQDYFVDLLKQSLEASGHKVTITVEGELPQKRMIMMMKKGDLSLTWMLQSKERDNNFTPVEVPITNGLIGHRLLLIPQGMQSIYDNVKTLEDFKQLNKVGVFGKNWFDIDVWELNGLNYLVKDGGWQETIYRQIAHLNKGIDYFSRGFFEILDEYNNNSFLAIEQNLMLIYDRDFRFYLSESSSKYKNTLTQSLEAARKSGLMDQLIKKHWKESFKQLNPDTRRKIYLNTPQY